LPSRQDATGILPGLVVWAARLRAHALENNFVLSPESVVMPELLTLLAANPFSLLCGFNMKCIDSLSTRDAALRCKVQCLFNAAHSTLDLYEMPVIRAMRNVFPVGSGRCSTTLSAVKRIIEKDSPDYFDGVVGHAHDALFDAHVLRYYTQTVRAMWSCLSM